MIRRTILFFFILLCVGYLVQLGQDQPGSVTLVWLGYETQTSALFLTILMAVIAIIMFKIGALWVWLNRLPKQFAQWRQHKVDYSALAALIQSHEALAAGDYAKVRKLSKQTSSLTEGPGFADLLEASAHMGKRNYNNAIKNYEKLKNNPKTKFLGIQGLLNASYMTENWSDSLVLAREAYQLKPYSPWVLEKLYEIYLKTGRFDAAQKLLNDELKRKKVFSDTQQNEHECALAMTIVSRSSGLEAKSAFDMLENVWKKNQNNVPLSLVYTDKLVQNGQFRKAEKILVKLWKVYPRQDIFDSWLVLVGSQPDKKLLEKAKKSFENDNVTTSSIAIASVLVHLKRYIEAKRLLTDLPKDKMGREVYDLLAKIEMRSGGADAQKYLKLALESQKTIVPADDQFARFQRWQEKYLPVPTALPKPANS